MGEYFGSAGWVVSRWASSYEILMPGNTLIWHFFFYPSIFNNTVARRWVADRIAWHKMINKKCKKRRFITQAVARWEVREMLMMDHKQKMQSKAQKVYKYTYIHMYIMCTRTTRELSTACHKSHQSFWAKGASGRLWECVLQPGNLGSLNPEGQAETETGVLGN